jgi:hypothetical protein
MFEIERSVAASVQSQSSENCRAPFRTFSARVSLRRSAGHVLSAWAASGSRWQCEFGKDAIEQGFVAAQYRNVQQARAGILRLKSREQCRSLR